jgi:hypothetical protein
MVRLWVLALVGACGFRASATPDSSPAPHGDALLHDDGAPSDAASISTPIVIEAESYTAELDSPSEAWSTATTIAGYSGASYMQCGPDSGAYCPNDANLATCAASMTYDLAIAGSATYYVHARTFGSNTSSDSLWYGIDGETATDAMSFTDDNTWHWQTGATTYALAGGTHMLTIYQRECGAIVDVVAVTTSTTNPP